MFDQPAIKELNKAQAIAAAANAVTAQVETLVALPDDFKLHDLETYLALRRRARGVMSTESLPDFAHYVEAHAEEGASVFVDAESMAATAVLNLGTPDEPGHADNRAKLALRKTAAYTSLKAHANGSSLSQAKAAEFLEDWSDLIHCYAENEEMRTAQAIAAVRDITIEAARKVESQEQQLSASKSSLESVTAKSKHTLPTHIYFKCVPFSGLAERTFVLRLGIQTGNDKMGVVLRIVKQETHDEEMAQEFASKVSASLEKTEYPVLVGSYTKS